MWLQHFEHLPSWSLLPTYSSAVILRAFSASETMHRLACLTVGVLPTYSKGLGYTIERRPCNGIEGSGNETRLAGRLCGVEVEERRACYSIPLFCQHKGPYNRAWHGSRQGHVDLGRFFGILDGGAYCVPAICPFGQHPEGSFGCISELWWLDESAIPCQCYVILEFWALCYGSI